MNITMEQIESIKKEALEKGIEIGQHIIAMIIEKIKNFGTMELDELPSVFSENLDKLIIAKRNEGNQYVGGKFHVKYNSDTEFEIGFELWFKSNDKIYKTENKGLIPNGKLSTTALKELKEKLSVSYDIDAPTEKSVTM